jgi:DNA-binding NarL/FixJ family response regulator
MLADDHAEMRQEMKRILAERKDFQVIGEAGDGLEVLNLLALHLIHPHLLILDVTMPHLSGIEVARKIKADYPEVKVLILTIHQEEEYLNQALTVGVQGYLLKKDADEDIFFAIEKILNGEFYLSPLLRKQHNA